MNKVHVYLYLFTYIVQELVLWWKDKTNYRCAFIQWKSKPTKFEDV